jgi:hypothetical protein
MPVSSTLSRRNLLRWGAAGAGVAIAGVALPNFGISQALAADLGQGDIGVLNYAYALEQLEAAFYTMVTQNPYGGGSQDEMAILAQIRDHEIAHRDFLKSALGSNAIPDLSVDFSAVRFSSRRSVLETANTFENLGVAAYNGAGALLSDVHHLAAAGTIVSVEARHCAVIAELMGHESAVTAGAGHVKGGLDGALSPKHVLPKVKPFVKTPVTAMYL